jgi:3',5'-cyclic AMP phosphodiesterase CpdA
MTRLFHVSDLHFGCEDEAALAWFADRVASERPHGLIVTGDLTMRARSREYAAAAEWLGQLDLPITLEPGNHDLPYFNPIARLFSPYRRYERLERVLERPLDLPGVWLVPLRTTARAQWRLNWSKGRVSDTRLKRALALLRARRAGDVAIVACHHPLVDSAGPDAKGSTRGGGEALRALAAAGAHAVLSGHVHDPFDVHWGAEGDWIRLVGAGTLSERVRASAPSFNELIVENGQLDVRLRSMDEPDENRGQEKRQPRRSKTASFRR